MAIMAIMAITYMGTRTPPEAGSSQLGRSRRPDPQAGPLRYSGPRKRGPSRVVGLGPKGPTLSKYDPRGGFTGSRVPVIDDY